MTHPTDFRISGLPAEPFQSYFAMTDAELAAHGASRVVATEADLGLMPPCRVSLRDAEVGERSILLHYAHHTAETSPYRASGPIYVREGVMQAAFGAFDEPRCLRLAVGGISHPRALRGAAQRLMVLSAAAKSWKSK